MQGKYSFINAQFGENIDVSPFATRLEKEVLANELPFLTLPFYEELCKEIEALRPYFSSYKHLLLLGIGGSALGARALQKAFAPEQDLPCHAGKSLWIMDNVDPEGFSKVFNALPLEETLVVTISKSGGTLETLAQYFIVKDAYKAHFGEVWHKHFLHITDKEKGFLREEVNTYGMQSLEVPDNLGGRYSVLSAVGMLPAAFLDIDYKAIMQGAIEIGREIAQDYAKLEQSDAWQLAKWAYSVHEKGYSQLIFFIYSPPWATFSAWFAQLWAESLGKSGKGSMPIPAIGVTDQHSTLQMFLDGAKDKACLFISSDPSMDTGVLPQELNAEWNFLKGKRLADIFAAEALATRMALVERKVPLVHAHYPKASCRGAGHLIIHLELATILTGWLLGINPINQEAVEEGKVLANAKLGSPKHAQYLERLNKFELNQ